MPFKVITDFQMNISSLLQHQQIKSPFESISTNSILLNNFNSGNLKNLLFVASTCESRVHQLNGLSTSIVNVELKNLSNSHEFDLILIAKNLK